jgi:hypothetical protein
MATGTKSPIFLDLAPVVAKLVDRNDRSVGAGVDHDDVLVDAHDLRRDHLADAHLLAMETLFEQRGKAFLRGNRGGNCRHIDG